LQLFAQQRVSPNRPSIRRIPNALQALTYVETAARLADSAAARHRRRATHAAVGNASQRLGRHGGGRDPIRQALRGNLSEDSAAPSPQLREVAELYGLDPLAAVLPRGGAARAIHGMGVNGARGAGHAFRVSSVTWYPADSGLFLSAGHDHIVKLWDTNM
jgi:hypothetical protein